MRMSMRRFTRLTSAFLKKAEHHTAALAPYFTFYNFVRVHKSLWCSPAMAADLSDRLWSMEDLVALVDAAEGPARPAAPTSLVPRKAEIQTETLPSCLAIFADLLKKGVFEIFEGSASCVVL